MRRLKLILISFLLFGTLPGIALAGTPLYPSDNERLGFGVTTGIQNFNVAPLHAGWYVNWGASPNVAHPAGMDFAQIVRTYNHGYSPTGTSLAAVIAQNPGSLWLIGNEPDCPYQDDVLPDNYVRVYHDAYYEIKGQDPTAQIAIGGIVQATPLRMQWLNMVWDGYLARYGETMPVDVWNVHNFVLNEVRLGYGADCTPLGSEWGAGIPPGLTTNCGAIVGVDQLDDMVLFREQIVRMRTWMRDHGQKNKPLIVSEYGILFNKELGYDFARVRDYMLATFDYFLTARDTNLGYPADDYHLVQRWAWYSLDDASFGWGTTYGALMDPVTKQMRPMGDAFAQYAAAKVTPYVDLQPLALKISTLQPIEYGQTGIVRLSLDVKNVGNTASSPSQISFWQGDPNQGGLKLGEKSLSSVPSRYNGVRTVTFDWSAQAVGAHQIVAVVDSGGQVVESNENNNRVTKTVSFGTLNVAVSDAGWQLTRGPLRAGEPAEISLGPATIRLSQTQNATAGLAILPPMLRATWYDGQPGNGGAKIATQTVTNTAFGQTAELSPQAWMPVVTAPRSVSVVIVQASGLPDTNSTDNSASFTLPATTDLTLSRYQQTLVPLGQPGELYDVALRFHVANLGTIAPGGLAAVGFWAGAQTAGAELARVQLAASGDWTDNLIWADLGVGGHPFSAQVDPDNAIQESNEANNGLSGIAIVARQRTYMPGISK